MFEQLASQLNKDQDDIFKRSWFDSHKYLNGDNSIEDLIKDLKAFEKSKLIFNDMIVICSLVDFKPLYISKNVEQMLGYTQDEYLSWGPKAFFKVVAQNQPDFWPNLLNWANQLKVHVPTTEIYLKSRFYHCGVSQLCKDGSTKYLLVRHEIVVSDEFELPETVVLYCEDITHFFKGTENWLLCKNFTDKGIIGKFFKNNDVENNIVSEREREVLHLIANGKATKEVANLLEISPDTVSQHRKNMIRRASAKDTSALIHMCKICEVI